MKKTIYLIIVILILFSGCSSNKKTECELLQIEFLNNLKETINPTGEFYISGNEGIIGATLINIEDLGNKRFSLTFKANNTQASMLMQTDSNDKIPYKILEFYKFDLANIQSGTYNDNNFASLEKIDCR